MIRASPKDTVALIAAEIPNMGLYRSQPRELGTTSTRGMPIKVVPISYAPILTCIESAANQDIDVLIYGAVGEQRLAVFASLGRLLNGGVSAVFASGLYGAARDGLIARSKIVLNINNIPYSKIFEIVRVSWLLANSKAVVADIYPSYTLKAISRTASFSCPPG